MPLTQQHSTQYQDLLFRLQKPGRIHLVLQKVTQELSLQSATGNKDGYFLAVFVVTRFLGTVPARYVQPPLAVSRQVCLAQSAPQLQLQSEISLLGIIVC